MKRKTSVKREDDDDARSAYETDDALTQYLEFHYARSDSYDGDIQHGRPPRFAGTLPASGFVEKEGCEGCHEFVPFPVRCTWFLMNALRASPKFLSRSDEGEKMRALDVGCAVGGATARYLLELARRRRAADEQTAERKAATVRAAKRPRLVHRLCPGKAPAAAGPRRAL